MTAIHLPVTRRKDRQLSLPPELWIEVFSYHAVVPTALDTKSQDFITVEKTSSEIRAANRVKLTLALVSKNFLELNLPFLYQFLTFYRAEDVIEFSQQLNNPSSTVNRNNLLHYTRLVDFRHEITTDTLNKSWSAMNQIVARCASLSHFMCLHPFKLSLGSDVLGGLWPPLQDSLQSIGRTLHLFAWRNAAIPFPIDHALMYMPSLRVLAVTSVLRSRPGPLNGSLPHLHTLIADGSLIASLDALAMPNLRSVTFLTTSYAVSYDAFFAAHGAHITHVACTSPRTYLEPIQEHLARACPALSALTVHVLLLDFLHVALPAVAVLGLVAQDRVQWEYWEYAFERLMGHFGSENSFPALKTVRIVERGVAEEMRSKKPHGLRIWVRRFSSQGIRLEDAEGEVLLPRQ